MSAASPHDAACDIQNSGDQHRLSTQSGSAPGVTESQTGSQSDPGQAKPSLGLPAVQDQSAAPIREGAQCKPEQKDAAASWQPKDLAVFPLTDTHASVVSYSDGELTVAGHGAPLGQILEKIKTLIGISIDAPQESVDNQIFDDIGPASARRVIEQLLDGSSINYVLLGSPRDPQRIQQIILTARTSAAPASSPGAAPGATTEQASGPALYGSGFSVDASTQTTAVEAASDPVSTIPVNLNIQQAAAASGKTPGQLLDELQKKQLQQLDSQAAQTNPQ